MSLKAQGAGRKGKPVLLVFIIVVNVAWVDPITQGTQVATRSTKLLK